MMDIQAILKQMVELKASDLHIKTPGGPVFRVDGSLYKNGAGEATPETVEEVFRKVATEAQQRTFYSENELDFCYSVRDLARFRVSVHRQRGTISLNFR